MKSMKILDKKRFGLGLILILLGSSSIIQNLIFFEIRADVLFWSVLLIGLGIVDCYSSFSKKETEKNFIEQTDERNKLIKLTSKARTLDIIQIADVIVIIFSLIFFKLTGDVIFGGMLILAGLSIPFIALVELITGIYYEEKR